MFHWIALISAIALIVAVAGAIVSSQQPVMPSQQQAPEKDHTEQANEKKEKALWDRWFPDSISVYTLFLVVFTGVLAFGGLIQLNLLNRAERIATNTAQASQKSADAANKAAEAAIAGNNLNRATFISAQRPWLKAKLEIDGPLIFEEKTARISFRYFARNTGRSPALSVVPSIHIHPSFYQARPSTSIAFVPDQELKRYCDQMGLAFEQAVQSGMINAVGSAIFPGDELNKTQVIVTMEIPTDRIFSPIVIFCVDYGSNIEIRRHQTGNIFHLIPRNMNDPASIGLLDPKPGKEIPGDQLQLVGATWGDYAN